MSFEKVRYAAVVAVDLPDRMKDHLRGLDLLVRDLWVGLELVLLPVQVCSPKLVVL
jgi:hypothetical protein